MLVLRINPKDAILPREVQIQDFPCKIGRSSDNQVTIRDPTISGLHAIIEKSEDGFYLMRDAGSTNGVFYQGQRVPLLKLTQNECFILGDVRIEIVTCKNDLPRERTKIIEHKPTESSAATASGPEPAPGIKQAASHHQKPLLPQKLHLIPQLTAAVVLSITILDQWILNGRHLALPFATTAFYFAMAALLAAMISAISGWLGKHGSFKADFSELFKRIIPFQIIASAANLVFPILEFNLDAQDVMFWTVGTYRMAYYVALILVIARHVFKDIPTPKLALVSLISSILVCTLGYQALEKIDRNGFLKFNGNISYPLISFTKENRPLSALFESLDKSFERTNQDHQTPSRAIAEDGTE